MLAGFTNLTETLLLTGIQTFRGFTQRLKLPPFPSALHGRFTGEAPILGGQARKPATHHPPITAAIEPRAKSLNQMFGKMPTLEKYRTRSTTWGYTSRARKILSREDCWMLGRNCNEEVS